MSVAESSKHELCKKLWIENEPKLKRLCAHKLSSHKDEIDDVLAETALIFWEAILDDKKIEYPGSWLYNVTNNLIKKKYIELNIKRERNAEFDEENLELYSIKTGYDWENTLISDDIIEKISLKIDSLLTEDEKMLYKYVYEEDLKMKEIAELLSTTEAAIKQKNYRMHRKVKGLVKKFLEKF